MRYLDQCQRSLRDRFPEEVCNAILGDHVMHVRPRVPYAIASLEQWFDSRSAIGLSGRQAEYVLATWGLSCPADETNLGGHSAVELAFELVDAHLACQVDRKGLGDRNHARLAGDLLGMAHLIYWEQLNTRVIVNKVVEPSRSNAIARDNTIAIMRFAVTCHHAGLDQVHHAVSDDVAIDAEVAPIPKM